MNLSVGIVGLPNVGKSTLFNTLTNMSVNAENYPFCTIEPNKGIVPIRDPRLNVLAKIVKAQNIIYPVIEFWDIAGLVKGASRGEGLGNKFLGNIKEVGVIAHVVRNFEDTDVIHVHGKVDPQGDIDTIELELIMKDLESVDLLISKNERLAKTDKLIMKQVGWLKELKQVLEKGQKAFDLAWSGDKDIDEYRRHLFLLTDKPQIYVFNVKDQKPAVDFNLSDVNTGSVQIDIKLENEISKLPEDERTMFMEELGIEQTGLDKLIAECFKLLGLTYFFTAGEKEVRGWIIPKNCTAPQAAATIHTDFEKNFIGADVVAYSDFVACGGWLGSKENGKLRLEGRDYNVCEADVMMIRHNA